MVLYYKQFYFLVYVTVKTEKESRELDSVIIIILFHLVLVNDSHALGQFFSQ